MSDRKLLPVEVEAEGYARDLLQWFDLASDEERRNRATPLEAMQAAGHLRRMAATIERLNRDLATERRLHRATEKRAETMRVERDVARRERDGKTIFNQVVEISAPTDMHGPILDQLMKLGPIGYLR